MPSRPIHEQQADIEKAMSVLPAGKLKAALQTLRETVPCVLTDAKSRAARLRKCEADRARLLHRLAGKIYDP